MSGLPHRILHGCAALLALALSAFGSPRLGEVRSGAPAPEQVLVRLADAIVTQAASDRQVAESAPAVATPRAARSDAPRGREDAGPGFGATPVGGRGPRAP